MLQILVNECDSVDKIFLDDRWCTLVAQIIKIQLRYFNAFTGYLGIKCNISI